MNRQYRSFEYKEAVFRIHARHFDVVTAEIVRRRHELEDHIRRYPGFQSSLTPLVVPDGAPESARRMARAAAAAGVGPMAAVAGFMAQAAALAGLSAGDDEVIVDNGGDIFLSVREPVTVGLYAGSARIGGSLAFLVEPSDTPVSICSSSGLMGHSFNMGRCDLATVVAADGALADAAATRAANLVLGVADIDRALAEVMAIPGVRGVMLVKDDRVGMAGKLPRLTRAA